jgi:hypothetical protein
LFYLLGALYIIQRKNKGVEGYYWLDVGSSGGIFHHEIPLSCSLFIARTYGLGPHGWMMWARRENLGDEHPTMGDVQGRTHGKGEVKHNPKEKWPTL